jgi:uncharacterized protein
MTKRSSLITVVGVTVLLISFILFASSEISWAQKSVRISIATGGTGGVWYPYGGAMANVISKYLPEVEATAEVTAASVDNARLLGAGKVDVAFIFGDVGYDAYMGKGVFKEKIPTMRCIASLYPSVTHIVSREGTGIEKVTDLKGKRISTGAPGSATEVIANRILEAYGVDPDRDIKKDRLSVAESVGALKDRKVDAFFWTGGIPTSAIMDICATPGIKAKLIENAEALPKLISKYGPIYYKSICPKNTYPGIDYDLATVTAGNFLSCLEKVDEKLVYTIIKTLFDHRDDLIKTHKVALQLKLEDAIEGSPYPYHPGAIKYYKEKGVWK